MPPRSQKAARKGPITAQNADKFVLYEGSVQDTEADIAFIERVYTKARGRKPLALREDFCGTAQLCADWAASHGERTAVGLDLHQPTMDWGTRRHLQPLGEAATRVQLVKRDVMDGLPPGVAKVDVAVAFNFSYCALMTRALMLDYFAAVHRGLQADGAFFLDIHGGTESFEEMEETTRRKGFTYVWDQQPYNPIDGRAKRHIGFRFTDGSEMARAFTYDWRLWTLPELRDILTDVGFSQVDVYWEGTDGKGEGNGVFRLTKKAVNEASWIAYIVAWP